MCANMTRMLRERLKLLGRPYINENLSMWHVRLWDYDKKTWLGMGDENL